MVDDSWTAGRLDDGRTEGRRIDDGRTGGGRTEGRRTDDGRSDDGRSDDGRSDDGRTDDSWTDDGRTDDSWVDVERAAAGACPSCGADAAVPVVYGMPTAGDFAQLQGRVAFAGCCLPQVLHRWSCRRCHHGWGS